MQKLNFMKKYLILLLSLLSFYSHSQIISSENHTKDKKEREKKEKKARIKEDRPKSGIELFAGISPAYTNRILTENTNVFGKPLGERAEEKGAWTVGYHIGARAPLAKNLKLEIGAGYSANRETFDYEAKDSIYRYKNTYQHIEIPIRLAYSYGDQVAFYGAIGVIPKGLLQMKREETLLDINNKEATEIYKIRDKHNFFLLDAAANLGIQFKLSEHWGMYLIAEGRYQLIDNYVKQAPYVRRPFAIGLNVGIEVYL